MGAEPKRKISKFRRGRRRANKTLTPPNLVKCSSCDRQRQSHQVCQYCGHYDKLKI